MNARVSRTLEKELIKHNVHDLEQTKRPAESPVVLVIAHNQLSKNHLITYYPSHVYSN